MVNEFKHKLVAVLNKDIPAGKLMNALAHMSLGIGADIGKEPLRLSHYKDAEGGSHPFISEIPFIILTANSNKIRNLRQDAILHNIHYNDFTDTMTVGNYHEQIERTKATKEPDLTYYGIVLFGDWDKLSELTRKFSLYK